MKNGVKWLAVVIILLGGYASLRAQEVTVLGSQKETIALIQADDWWAKKKRGQPLKVPYKMVVGIPERWRKNAPKLPVATKKKIFFICVSFYCALTIFWSYSG